MAYSASPVASLVEGTTSNGGTTSAIDTSGCDILFVAVSSYQGATAPTLSDSKSNSWTGLTLQEVSGNNRIRLFYCVAPSVGSGHTFTLTGTACYGSVAVAGFSGGKQTSPFDVEAGTNTVGTSITPGSVTPSEDNEIVISAITTNGGNNPSIDGGFTRVGYVDVSGGNYFGVAIGFLVQTSAAAANPTWSWSGSNTCAGTNATFKAEPASGTTRGAPFGARGTAFNGGRTMMGLIR